MMRVLHLIDSGGLYGAEKVLLDLVEAQQRDGLSPMILSAGLPGEPEKPLESAARVRGLPVLPWRMTAGLNLLEAWRILRYAAKGCYQVLHSHGYKFDLLMGVWPRGLRRVALVSTIHGYVKAPALTKMWVYEILDRIMLRRMDAVVVVNPGMLEEPFCRRIRSVKAIPNGISKLSDAAGAVDAGFDVFASSHHVVVGGVGRLAPEKGFDNLLKAVARCRERVPGMGVMLLGEGRERQALTELATSLGITEHVWFGGYRENAVDYLRHLDVLVIPSHTEGLPMVLLESLQCGVPVVASAVGAIPSVLQGGQLGSLVPPGDVLALGEAIVASGSEDPAVAARAVRAKEHVLANYSAEAMSRSYERLYESVVGSSRGDAR